ncbi:glycosyltransferase family 2 protein [Leeuwenhoekiella aestuarii]|uniref:Glycosyltransferase involved in cell wall biosynthesis n=1 Tax=Leeuwenhoekiella aestuarii TaxID=2249426 RepID=A0A4Q0NS93_9FLAO|nr:glycosyltransferase family 2 protein [Leeuwenhoekiella aestuarii]RXG12336.1 glycosyltransferase involved in cell wall biosynthesis [Leeuwenhoekiella aestuarii]
MQPKISIIIPVYNREEIVCKTLQSLKNQTLSDWECIVVDDSSTDDTLHTIQQFIKADNRFQLFERPKTTRKGPSSCRNIGLSKSKSNFIIFLDSDDLLSKTALMDRLSFAFINPKYDFWIFKTLLIENNKRQDYNSLPQSNTNENKYYVNILLKGESPFVVSSPLWRKQVLNHIDGFDINLSNLEDLDLHIRAYKAGFESKTDFNGIADNYYVKNQQLKKRIPNNKILFSYWFYLKRHGVSQSEQSKILINRIFFNYIFKSFSFFWLVKYFISAARLQLLTISKIISGFLLFVGYALGLDNYKYTGMYRLRNYFMYKNE